MSRHGRRLWGWLGVLAVALPGCTGPRALPDKPLVRIGAKAFPESQILGEMLRLLTREAGAETEDLQSLGDTGKVWNALLVGQIDAYCEYTGTLTQQLLVGEDVGTPGKLRRALARRGLRMSRSLGFSNSYGLGMTRKRAGNLGIHTISDLRKYRELKIGLSARSWTAPTAGERCGDFTTYRRIRATVWSTPSPTRDWRPAL